MWVPELQAAFILDTGSARSFISPELVQKYYADCVRHELFEVVSTHAVSRHDTVAIINLPSVFKSNERHKFHVYNVDDRYGGLLGSDLLRKLDAVIDMKHQQLNTQSTSMPIIYEAPKQFFYKKPLRCDVRVGLPVNVLNSETNFEEKFNKARCLNKEMHSGYNTSMCRQNSKIDRIEAILKYPLPRSLSEIKCFLGLLEYYRRLIKDYSKITKPLRKCLKKRKIVITNRYKHCFQNCKNQLLTLKTVSKPPVLTNNSVDLMINNNDNINKCNEVAVKKSVRIEFNGKGQSSVESPNTYPVSNGKSEKIPVLFEAIDSKPKQILVYAWDRNAYQVKDVSNKTQRILEVYLPVNNRDLVKGFLKEYVDLSQKCFVYYDNNSFRETFSAVINSLLKKGNCVNLVECTDRAVNLADKVYYQRKVILKYHEGKNSHKNIRQTLKHIKKHYMWPNMIKTVSNIINSCESCKTMKYERGVKQSNRGNTYLQAIKV